MLAEAREEAIREEFEGRVVSWCRHFAFLQDPAERGHGFT